MDKIDKPIVVISKCLEFAKCRYNGVMIGSPEVQQWKDFIHFIPICPEVEIGLGVPRHPIRIISPKGERKLIQPETGRDITQEMNSFIETFFSTSNLPIVDGFILKEKSPSCGIRRVKIYPGPGKVAVASQGAGFFGSAVLERYGYLPREDEGRIKNFNIREHFLTSLYATYRFRKLREEPTKHGLVEFQARNKLIFMAYNQSEMRQMGRITANPGKQPLEQVIEEYALHFNRVFSRQPRHTAHINVLQHALGYVSQKISTDERDFFLHLLEQFRIGKQPLSVCIGIMKSWILRFKIDYLKSQYYFDPYPAELMNLADSGKMK